MYDFNENDMPFLITAFKERPLSLMVYPKLKFIVDYIDKFNVSNILEIGTFAAGTTYFIASSFPEKPITTVDINKFESYFSTGVHAEHLKEIQKSYPTINIQADSFVKIQQIYKNECPNITLVEGDWRSLDISSFDLIIIDGDHSEKAVLADLTYAYDNIKLPGIIMVDDCLFQSIKDVVVNFCKEHNLEVSFSVERTAYNYLNEPITGPDLALIHITER
jgi:predicted O-methyltransferase YrrM